MADEKDPYIPEGKPYILKFNEDAAKFGLFGGITFFDFEVAVHWDFMLDRGYGVEIMGDLEATHGWVRHIRGQLAGSVRPVAQHQWFEWSLATCMAWVRRDKTNELFKELQLELNGTPAPRRANELPWMRWGENLIGWAPWGYLREQPTRRYRPIPQRLKADPRVLRWALDAKQNPPPLQTVTLPQPPSEPELTEEELALPEFPEEE